MRRHLSCAQNGHKKNPLQKQAYKGFTKACVTHHKRAYNSSFSDEVITIKNNQQFRKTSTKLSRS